MPDSVPFSGIGDHIIRTATVEDSAALFRMGEAFFREAGYAHEYDFVYEDFAKILDALGPHGLLIVAEKNGQVIGMAAADVACAFWNRSVRIGREAFWYVDPEHRKGVGRDLLGALECAARKVGATIFDVVAEEGEGKRGEALGRLYRRASYRPVERTFRKRLL